MFINRACVHVVVDYIVIEIQSVSVTLVRSSFIKFAVLSFAASMTESWDEAPAAAEVHLEIKLFNRWSADDVQVNDISLTVSVTGPTCRENLIYVSLLETEG